MTVIKRMSMFAVRLLGQALPRLDAFADGVRREPPALSGRRELGSRLFGHDAAPTGLGNLLPRLLGKWDPPHSIGEGVPFDGILEADGERRANFILVLRTGYGRTMIGRGSRL